jgi:glycosyltransferase involved in cell wall biosynthesis
MEKVEELAPAAANRRPLLAVSVIIAARNEGHNIARCLDSVREAFERYVVDSQSSDNTLEIVESCGAKVVQFRYPRFAGVTVAGFFASLTRGCLRNRHLLRRRSLSWGRRLHRRRSGLCLRMHVRCDEARETHREHSEASPNCQT